MIMVTLGIDIYRNEKHKQNPGKKKVSQYYYNTLHISFLPYLNRQKKKKLTTTFKLLSISVVLKANNIHTHVLKSQSPAEVLLPIHNHTLVYNPFHIHNIPLI